MTNGFGMCDAEMQNIGVGLYPSASLLNHSCQPNCVAVFAGKDMLVRAVRDIPSGGEVCYIHNLRLISIFLCIICVIFVCFYT